MIAIDIGTKNFHCGYNIPEGFTLIKNNKVPETKLFIREIRNNLEVQHDLEQFKYNLKENRWLSKILIRNKISNMCEIYRRTLEKILKLAEADLNKKITEAVITVPAYFSKDQRKAVEDAAKMEGLQSVCIIDEPSAAVLAFKHCRKLDTERCILVYDFGEGTLDVSIVSMQDQYIKVLATDGDCNLGGANIDLNLLNFMIKELLEKYSKISNFNNQFNLQWLKHIAESLKKNLSSEKRTLKQFPIILQKSDLLDLSVIGHGLEDINLENFEKLDLCNFSITREIFENINLEIFEKCMQIVERCLNISRLNKNDIDKVILVGGSTNIPKIRKMLKEYFGEEKICILGKPDCIILHGAATHAESFSGNKAEATTNQGVLSWSLGTEVFKNQMSIIIKRNTLLPCESYRKYVTIYDNQSEMNIKIYQGEKSIASENVLLGDFAITNLTPAPKGKVWVKIKFALDASGMLCVTAKELYAEKKKTLNIELKNVEYQEKKDLSLMEYSDKKKELEQYCSEMLKDIEGVMNNRKDVILKKVDDMFKNNYCLE